MRKMFFIVLVSLVAVSVQAQSSFTQTGMASFYADKFQGRTTASGERYDKNKLTCAHLSLPFGTVLRVTCLDNNRTTVVRVNDRGPFSPDRIIDLSMRAAEALGIVSAGTGKVRIEVVKSDELVEMPVTTPESVSTPVPQQQVAVSQPAEPAVLPDKTVSPQSTPAVSAPSQASDPTNVAGEIYRVQVASVSAKGYAVQLASYQGLSNLLRRMGSAEVSNPLVYVVGAEPNVTYKLMAGPFSTRAQADREKEKLGKRFPGCFVVQL